MAEFRGFDESLARRSPPSRRSPASGSSLRPGDAGARAGPERAEAHPGPPARHGRRARGGPGRHLGRALYGPPPRLGLSKLVSRVWFAGFGRAIGARSGSSARAGIVSESGTSTTISRVRPPRPRRRWSPGSVPGSRAPRGSSRCSGRGGAGGPTAGRSSCSCRRPRRSGRPRAGVRTTAGSRTIGPCSAGAGSERTRG